MATAVFPRQAEAVIGKEEVMRRIILQDDKHPHGQAIMDFLYRFLDAISQDAEGKIYMITVNCSTQIELLVLFGLHSSLFRFLSGKWDSRKGTGKAGTKTLGAGKERKKYSFSLYPSPVQNFLLSPHAFAQLPLSLAFYC